MIARALAYGGLAVVALVAVVGAALASRADLGSAGLAGPVHGPSLRGGGLEAWTTHGLDKVRPHDPPRAGGPPRLAAARNEFEPFQLVLRPTSPARGVRGVDVEADDLVAPGGARIASRHVAVFLERYVTLGERSSVDGAAGEWPDPLVPRVDAYRGERRNAFPFDLRAGRNQPLWIEVYVPPGTAAGLYRGGLRVSAEGRPALVVPWTLEVLPFELPSTSTLRSSFGFSGIAALRAHYGGYTDDEDLYRLSELYARAALRHRLSLHGGSFVPPTATFDEAPPRTARVDWSGWERELGPFLDGTVFGPGEPLAGARITSFDVRTIAGLDEARTVAYWRAWASHLRARGGLDRAFLYLWDEPGAGDYPAVRRRATLARAADPALRTLVTEQLEPGLAGAVDLWAPLVNCLDERRAVEKDCDQIVPRRAYAPAERAGASLWWYQSCSSHGCNGVGGEAFRVWPSYVVDAPAIAHRVLPWLAWRHGVEGELYYNTVEAWADATDPWRDLYRHGGNGDGTLFYPGTPARIGGASHVPVESLRLKLIREGLEDHEYLVQLAARAGVEAVRRAAAPVGTEPHRWTRDPETLYLARDRIARELARTRENSR